FSQQKKFLKILKLKDIESFYTSLANGFLRLLLKFDTTILV
ncbi:33419_t:CDS:1, partial [Racocetra persica]